MPLGQGDADALGEGIGVGQVPVVCDRRRKLVNCPSFSCYEFPIIVFQRLKNVFDRQWSLKLCTNPRDSNSWSCSLRQVARTLFESGDKSSFMMIK